MWQAFAVSLFSLISLALATSKPDLGALDQSEEFVAGLVAQDKPCEIQTCTMVREASTPDRHKMSLKQHTAGGQVCEHTSASATIGTTIRSPTVVLPRGGSIELCTLDPDCVAANARCAASVQKQQAALDAGLAGALKKYELKQAAGASLV